MGIVITQIQEYGKYLIHGNTKMFLVKYENCIKEVCGTYV